MAAGVKRDQGGAFTTCLRRAWPVAPLRCAARN